MTLRKDSDAAKGDRNFVNTWSRDKEHLSSCDYYTLFEQATDAIMVADFTGRIMEVNSSFCNMLGYTREELIGNLVQEIVEPSDLEANPIPFDQLA